MTTENQRAWNKRTKRSMGKTDYSSEELAALVEEYKRGGGIVQTLSPQGNLKRRPVHIRGFEAFEGIEYFEAGEEVTTSYSDNE